MADYPEWVMKFKEKGTYVNYVKGKYYLYAAHSKRVPDTKKINRVCDGYLGRITEEDGLIPPKDKVSGIVLVLEYGLSSTILAVYSNIHKGFKKTFTKNGDFVMAAAILCFIYGQYSEELFRHSYISGLRHLNKGKIAESLLQAYFFVKFYILFVVWCCIFTLDMV